MNMVIAILIYCVVIKRLSNKTEEQRKIKNEVN